MHVNEAFFILSMITTDGSGSFKIGLSSDDGSLPAQVLPVATYNKSE